MLLAAVNKPDPFYRRDPDKLWGAGIRPAIMTDKQLASELLKGVTTYNTLYPPNNEGLFGTPVGWIMLAVVGVAAVALTAGAAAPAVSGAVSSGTGTATAAGTTAATAGTASTAATAAKGMVTAQKLATGYQVAGRGANLVGVDTPDGLDRAAGYLSASGSAGDLAFQFVAGEIEHKNNLKLTAQGEAALKEQIERERKRQAALLRQRAARLRATGHPSTKIDWFKWAPLAIPFVILLIQKKT